jgi:hypothetical protein
MNKHKKQHKPQTPKRKLTEEEQIDRIDAHLREIATWPAEEKQKLYAATLEIYLHGGAGSAQSLAELCAKHADFAAWCIRQEGVLHKQKRYDDLFNLMGPTDSGIVRFFELCRADEELGRWWMAKEKAIWHEILGDPEKEAFMRAALEKDGHGDAFALYKNVFTFGAVSMEEIARVFGVSVEEQIKMVEENPELQRHVFVAQPH